MANITYVLYQQINALEEFAFIAGTNFTLYFDVFEQDGVTPLDMNGGTFKWVLTPYGETINILEKEGTITDVGEANVELETNDTLLMSGKYIHQPVIISFSGQEYRPSQGVILIQQATPLN